MKQTQYVSSLSPILILFFIGFLVFGPSLNNGFVWDDEEQIVNSTVIRDIRNIPVIFSGGAFHSGGTGKLLGIYYKPLMTMTFTGIYALFHLDPFFYHLTSLLLHIINASLVYVLFRKFFRGGLSLFLAALFLVHPLTSEVVLYAADMQDVLYFFFGLLGLLIGGPVSALFFLASLLSKETGVVFIVLSILFSLLYNRKNIRWALISGFFALSAYAFLRFGVAGIYFPNHGMAPIARLTVVERLINIPAVLSYFLVNVVAPINLAVSQQWVVREIGWNTFYLPLAVIVFFLLFLIRLMRRIRPIRFFFLLFLLGLLPHLQIFPLDVTVSGRWMYVPVVGLLGMTGTLLPKRYTYLLLLPIILFSGITFRRTFDFADGYTLYSHDLTLDPDNFNLENNLGVELYRMGSTGEAAEHFERSITLNPFWWTSYNNLGAYWEQRGDLDQAASYYQTAIKNGNYYLAYENYAGVLIKEKRYEEAKTFIEDSLRYFPENSRLREFYTILR